MTLTTVCEVSFVAAAIPAVLFCWNLCSIVSLRRAPSRVTAKNLRADSGPQ